MHCEEKKCTICSDIVGRMNDRSKKKVSRDCDTQPQIICMVNFCFFIHLILYFTRHNTKARHSKQRQVNLTKTFCVRRLMLNLGTKVKYIFVIKAKFNGPDSQ